MDDRTCAQLVRSLTREVLRNRFELLAIEAALGKLDHNTKIQINSHRLAFERRWRRDLEALPESTDESLRRIVDSLKGPIDNI